jgi:hypothetical protein
MLAVGTDSVKAPRLPTVSARHRWTAAGFERKFD